MSNNYGIIIQCRDHSTRFPLKSVRPFWKGKSILEIIYKRVEMLDLPVVVATTYHSPITRGLCKKLGAYTYIGSENLVAGRLWQAARRFGLDGFFRICADNPFIQLPLMYPVKAWVSHEVDYVAYKDCMKRHEGFWLEYIKTDALEKSLYLNNKTSDYEHVTPYIIRHPELFKQKILPIPDDITRVPIRLTVDTASDFYIARKVYKYCKDMYWAYILFYVNQNLDIRKAMIKNRMENRK